MISLSKKKNTTERNISHACGHKANVVIKGGDAKKKESFAKWLTTRPCVNCLKEEQLEKALKADLPTLKGTENQVAWATSIRARYLAFVGGEPEEKLMNQTEAKYWIEKRDSLFKKKKSKKEGKEEEEVSFPDLEIEEEE